MILKELKDDFKSKLLKIASVEQWNQWKISRFEMGEKYLDLKPKKNEIAFCWLLLRRIYHYQGLCEIYEKYNVNDEHLTRFAKTCLKELKIL